MQPGWKPFANLAQSPVSNVDQNIILNRQQLQMHRTVALLFKTTRDDILQGYLRLIGCATRFIFMENQYFREKRIADAIVNQAKAHPGLIVIIVVAGELDDKEDALLKHGNRLQYEFFGRLFANLGQNQLRVYTMFKRWVHSKLIMADDHALSVGSANCNPRGFFLDTELNVMLNNAGAVESFRHRLWSHDLGVPQTTVAKWRVSDFIPQWNKVAIANEALTTPDQMTGEGVIRFDHTKEKGERTPLSDVFFELNQR
jgi:phospholipase D1/2